MFTSGLAAGWTAFVYSLFALPAGGVGSVITVGSGGDASIICDAVCGSIADTTCLPGSGIELARALSPSLANPVEVFVGPGRYDECVAINNFSQLAFHVAPAVTIRPTVTALGSSGFATTDDLVVLLRHTTNRWVN